jgi:spermidine synthase
MVKGKFAMQTISEQGVRIRPWKASFIVFLSSGAIMVLELVAGRLMAPLLGVSLYTWTSIIGVILAGISLGNFAGGLLADRFASRGTLALLFGLSAAASASILWTIDATRTVTDLPLPVMAQVLLAFATAFLLPAVLLGTISPVVVKLTLADLGKTGNVVGRIYAAGAAGSIAGTFLTGFWLISHFGTRTILWGVSGVLLLVGLFASWGQRRALALSLPALLIYAGLAPFVWSWNILGSRCLYETNYFCIRVHPDDDDPRIQVLTLDRLVHSYVNLEDPTDLRYGYERIYRDVLTAVTLPETPISAFFIGGGGYTFPRYIEVSYPNSSIEVAEIDPGVTRTAYEHLALPRDTRIVSVNEDARHYLEHLPRERRFSLILGDAFNDFSVPYHLTTLEFNQLVAEHLSGDGFYMVNIIDGRHGDFLRAYVLTLGQVFKHVYISPVGSSLGGAARQTYVIVAAQHPMPIGYPIPAQRIPIGDDAAPPRENSPPVPDSLRESFISQAEWEDYLNQGTAVLLTDDFVPVDNLLAPVFSDSGL